MEDEDWKAFHRATNCHICHKSLYKYNEKDEIEFWHPVTGEYCGKVHKYTKAPDSQISCYSEALKLEAHGVNGNFIKQWHPRVQESKKESFKRGLKRKRLQLLRQAPATRQVQGGC